MQNTGTTSSNWRTYKETGIKVEDGTCHVSQVPEEVQFHTKSFTKIGKRASDIYDTITNLVVYLGFSVVKGNIIMTGRSSLNCWPTRLFVSNTVKFGKHAKIIGFDEVIYFQEEDLSIIRNDICLFPDAKRNLISVIGDICSKYHRPTNEPLTDKYDYRKTTKQTLNPKTV